MIEIIKKKRDGLELSQEDYAKVINGFVSGSIPDYQISAFLMAIYFKGLNNEETAILTDIMMRSGDLIDLSAIKGIKVDKHSTGGVGDKTTLVLGPLVAAAGVPVAKMSGRGLGHTGGTLDKMESISGLSVDMTRAEFIDRINKHGIAICGQNAKLVPADKKLYALRDVTGTVNNAALIASSIMSKKLACGADAIVIDIKVGEGAFMKTEAEAKALAKIMISIGEKMHRNVVAVISAMHQPLGFAVGNALEVKEAIETLKGNGPEDLTQLCLELGSHMLVLGKVCTNYEEGVAKLKSLIKSGEGLHKLKELVEMQGGDVSQIDQPDTLPGTQYSEVFNAPKTGYICKLNALEVGLASVNLGAGRETKDSVIDYGAGILLQKKIGDHVKMADPMAILYSNDQSSFIKAKELLNLAYQINDTAPQIKPLILNTIT